MLLTDAITLYERYTRYELKEPTRKRYRNDLRQLALSLKNIDIQQISRDMILLEIDTMTALGWDQKSLFQKLSAYRVFFKFLQKHGYISLNPEYIPKVKVEFVEPRVATDEEYQAVLGAIPEKGIFCKRNRAMVHLLWDTGVRVGELCAFNLSDLPKLSKNGVWEMTIRTEKSRTKRPFRQIFWTDETQEVLSDWLKFRAEYANKHEIQDKDALFIALNTGKGRRVTVQCPESVLVRYSAVAGVRNMNPHSFRHAKARRIIERGGSNSDVMNILGHSSLSSSEIYTTLYGSRLNERASNFL